MIKSRVAPPEFDHRRAIHDVVEDRVYERKKKEAKNRDCFLSFYAPICRSYSYTGATGVADAEGQRESRAEQGKRCTRVAALCRIHHSVGDCFAVVHAAPAPMLQFDGFQELQTMPGGSFDNLSVWPRRSVDQPTRIWAVSISAKWSRQM